MGHPVVFSHLWSKNQHVCVELARNHNFDIATLPGALTAEQITAIEGVGRRCIILDAAAWGVDGSAAQAEATARFAQLQTALPAHLAAVAGPELGSRIGSAMLRAAGQHIANVLHFVDSLEALGARENLVGVLLNESDLPASRAAALWCRGKGVPTFVLSHGVGVGEAYTVTADVIADYMLFVGERGMEPYLDAGFPRDRMMICGNPAWDRFPQILARRESIRAEIYRQIGIDARTPVVVFGTTWNSRITALRDAAIYEQTLAAFLRACRELSDSGTPFHAVIKDRPPNAEFGKALLDKLAAQSGFSAYSYATGDMFTMLVGADLFVGVDTSAFIEAAIAGVPSIDIWTPSSWLLGPALDRNDGILMVQQSHHKALGEAMGAVLIERSARAQALERMAASLGRFTSACDGRAAERCAAAVASKLPAVPAPAPEIATPGALAPAAEPGARTIVTVLGMHRAGTSLTTAMLQALGVRLSDNLMPATEANAMGYFEAIDIVDTHDAILKALGRTWASSSTIAPYPADWTALPNIGGLRSRLKDIARTEIAKSSEPWGFKDPRTAQLLPLWLPIARELEAEIRYVIVLRHPREVADSLRKRDGMDPTFGELLWVEHYLDSLIYTTGSKRTFVSYDEWFDGTAGVAQRLAQALGLPPPDRDRVETLKGELVSPDLRHHRKSENEACALPFTAELYSAMLARDESTLQTLTALLQKNRGFTSQVVRCALELNADAFREQRQHLSRLEAELKLLRQ